MWDIIIYNILSFNSFFQFEFSTLLEKFSRKKCFINLECFDVEIKLKNVTKNEVLIKRKIYIYGYLWDKCENS